MAAFFWSLGAWPVLGFASLDVLAIWIAFLLNYRASNASEEIEVSRGALVIRKVSPGGRRRELRLNPRSVRLHIVKAGEDGVAGILVRSGASEFAVGAFLNPPDRESFAAAFRTALAQAAR
jgi:uncharacterized membrane protein